MSETETESEVVEPDAAVAEPEPAPEPEAAEPSPHTGAVRVLPEGVGRICNGMTPTSDNPERAFYAVGDEFTPEPETAQELIDRGLAEAV